jgi:hypothetical protein
MTRVSSFIHPASEYGNHAVIADCNAPSAVKTPIHSSARKVNGTSDHRRLMSGVSDVVSRAAWRFLRLRSRRVCDGVGRTCRARYM